MNKKNSYDYKKILILISLMIIFSLSFITPNIYTNKIGNFDNPNDDTTKELENNDLRSQGLTSDNFYDGIGAAWNLTHWANRTDNNLEVSFENNSYDIKNMPLDIDWIGYKLNATIKDLYDKRNWVNGTFHAGPDDNDDNCPENDSIFLQNWTFHSIDVVEPWPNDYHNDMSGNYFNSTNDPSNNGSDCLELRMNGDGYGYNKYDRCWWESNFTLPRGKVIEGEINLVIYPYTQYYYTREFGTHWSVQVILNGVVIDDKNLIWLEDSGGSDWYPLKLQLTNWLDDPTVFPDNEKNMSLRIQLIRNGPTFDYNDYGTYQEVLFDNVSLIVKAEVKPTQISLNMNQTTVSNSTNWGEGTVEIDGNWNGTQYPWVHANFNSSEIWPSELGGYNITFKTDLNLFAIKHSPETNYETNYDYIGTKFSVSNDSLVNWECYGYTSVPTGYTETDMKLEFPTDVNITWISYPSDPLTNKLDLCDNSTSGLLIVNVSKISETPDGFWKFEALSPNYCEQLTIYKNGTNNPNDNVWNQNTVFLSGDYANITGKVTSTAYIQQTKAYLNVRFPNGTIWTDKTQEKSPDANGFIYFDYFQIPLSPPDYEVGEYDAIITWNNSHSIYGLNETGIIYKKFTVMHNSTLIPDQSYYADIFESTLINLKVSFNDKENGDAIENAIVYLYNFTGGLQCFSEISPGYYFLEFNVSEANVGNNTLTIYANSSLYENNKVNISIEVILATTLTADKSFLSVPWGQNFTIQFNYTEKYSGNGIATTPTSNWIGESHIIPTALGEYNITCNTSAYQVNQLHSLIIEVDEVGYESQSILIKIEVSERETDIDAYLNQTLQTAIVFPYDEVLNITAIYKDYDTGNFIDGAIVQLKDGETVIGTLSKHATLDQYYLLKNTADLGIGVNSLSIYAKLDNYSAISIGITITVTERETDMDIYLNQTLQTAIVFPYDEVLNITAIYKDYDTGNFIDGATVLLKDGETEIGTLSKHATLDQYYLLKNTADLGIGVNSLSIYAKLDNYSAISIGITITVTERETDMDIYLNQTLQTAIVFPYDEVLNITAIYIDHDTGNFIDGATVLLKDGETEIGTLSKHATLDQYYLLKNTADFGIGVKALTIYAKKDNYSVSLASITITVSKRDTDIFLFVNETDITVNKSYQIQVGETINITIKYTDEQSGAFIVGALVEITGGDISDNLTENSLFEYYNITLGVENFTKGYNFLTITAKKENYTFQSISFTIELIERQTNLTLFVNQTDITDTKTYQIQIGETINITIKYMDEKTGVFIDGALVEITGGDISANLTENSLLEYYNITLGAENFTKGYNFLTITAEISNYQFQYISFTIELIERQTNLKVFLNDTSTTSFELTFGEYINITVEFHDNKTGAFIDSALVEITGGDISAYLMENILLGQYYIIISAENLTEGYNFLTISAEKENYQFQYISLTIELFERETYMKLYLNGTPTTSFEVIFGEFIYITVEYRDNKTDEFLDSSLVKLIGEDISFNLMKHPSLNQYIAIVNTEDLGIGIKSLTISAKKEKYEVSSMVLTISITYRGTYSILFLNEINKTLDKSIELPIGANLNITFEFMNTETEEFIDLALVQLVGADKTWNFTENTILKRYILIISSRELNIGINFLTIFARKTNYESSTVLLKITVRQIITNITTETGEDIINIQAGDSVHLKITLKDLDFDSLITNATIKYTWDLGQGYIIDDNKDGIYELILDNIQAGTFTIYFTVVNVSADYLFETKVITITSIPKQEDTFLITLLLGVSIVGIIALSSYFVAYQRVLKFPLPVRKIHKFKKTLKKKKSPDVEILSSKVLLKALYNEELDPVAKLFKGKMKYEQPEKQLELKPSKDELIDTLSEISPEESEKNEK